MRFVFFETQLFTRLLPSYLHDGEFRRLQAALMCDPERGDLIYDKSEGKDLTALQCRSLRRAIHEELSVRRGNA